MTIQLQAFANKVKRDTKGKISFTIFPSNQLGADDVIAQELVTGSMDAALLSTGSFQSTIQELGILDLGFLYPSLTTVGDLLAGSLGKSLAAKLAPHNVVVMFWTSSGFRDVMSTKPLKGISGFAGLKIRTITSPAYLGFWKALGANPLGLQLPQIYPAFQTGLIDAVEVPPAALLSLKFYEVAKNVLVTNHIQTANMVCITKKQWDQIPKYLQKIVLRDGLNAQRQQISTQTKQNAQALQTLQQNGVTVTNLSKTDLAEMQKESRVWDKTYAAQIGMATQYQKILKQVSSGG